MELGRKHPAEFNQPAESLADIQSLLEAEKSALSLCLVIHLPVGMMLIELRNYTLRSQYQLPQVTMGNVSSCLRSVLCTVVVKGRSSKCHLEGTSGGLVQPPAKWD